MIRFDDVAEWEEILQWIKNRSIGAGPDAEALIERLVEIDLLCDAYEEENPDGEDPELIRNYAVIPSINGSKPFEACAFRINIPNQPRIGLYFEISKGKITKYGDLSELCPGLAAN